MAVARKWAGRIYGTNTGNIFVSLHGETDAQLSGKLRINDEGVGIAVYSVSAQSDGSAVTITGEPENLPDGVNGGTISATGRLSPSGGIEGDWETTLGTGGTFVLHPHHQASDEVAATGEPEQLHTARHNFDAIEITRHELEQLADKLAADMKGSVVVTVASGSEQSRYLPAFKTAQLPFQRAQVAKLHCRVSRENGLDDIVHIEFGPSVNYITAQSADESWALGTVEKFKRELRPRERFYSTRIRRWGIGINDLIIGWAIIMLPDLPNLAWRFGAFSAALLTSRLIAWFHDRYVPYATIWIGPKSDNPLAKISPSVLSTAITVLSGLIVAISSAYALNVLGLNAPNGTSP